MLKDDEDQELTKAQQEKLNQQVEMNVNLTGLETGRPRSLNEPFIKKGTYDKIMDAIFTPKQKKKTYKGYVFLQITADGDIKPIKNVEPGEVYITKTRKGKKRGTLLARQKLLNLKNGEEDIKCWIGPEDSFLPYPYDDRLDGELIYNYIQSINSDNKLIDEKALSEKHKRWIRTALYVLFGLIVAAYLITQTGILDSILGAGQSVMESAGSAVGGATEVIPG